MRKIIMRGLALAALLLLATAWNSPAGAQCSGGMMGMCSDTTCHEPGQPCSPTNCPGGMMGGCMTDSTCNGGMMGGCHQGGGGSCPMPNCPMNGMCNMMGMNCGGMMGGCPDSSACHGGMSLRDRVHARLSSRPNPFNPLTALSYSLQSAGQVRLTIWDTAGRQVTVLVDGWQEPGAYAATFNGAAQPAGIYLARLQVGPQTSAVKLVLIK